MSKSKSRSKLQRRNDRIEELEAQVATLEEQTRGHSEVVTSIETENVSLRDRVKELENERVELQEWQERLAQEDMELQQKVTKFEAEQEEKTLKTTRRRLRERGEELRSLKREYSTYKREKEEELEMLQTEHKIVAKGFESAHKQIEYLKSLDASKIDEGANTKLIQAVLATLQVYQELKSRPGFAFTPDQEASITRVQDLLNTVLQPVTPVQTEQQPAA